MVGLEGRLVYEKVFDVVVGFVVVEGLGSGCHPLNKSGGLESRD